MRHPLGAAVGWARQCAPALAMWALMVAPATAEPILDFIDADPTGSAVVGTFGWSFRASSPLNVFALGIWDEGGNGLSLSHSVGLWDNAGTLIAQATVDNASVPVSSMSPAGRWMFTNVSPIRLAAGTYVLGAFYPNLSDNFRQEFRGPPIQILTINVIEYLDRRLNIGNNLRFPNEVFGPGGYFGPNLVASVIPEPSTLVMGVIGLICYGGWHLGRQGRKRSGGCPW